LELVIENLSFTYPGGVRALDGVSFKLKAGEKLALIGPNGAGKSTLLLLLAGLVKGKGVEGVIRWLDRGGRTVNPGRVGFLFQNPDDQIIGTSVEDDVGFLLLKRGMEKPEADRRVKEVLRQVHLEGYERRVPFEMSFGEKKRLGLAGVLAAEPEFICLDEPDLGLDFREKNQLIRILRGISQSLIVASLDPDLLAGLSDRVLVLDGGKLVAGGSPADTLTDRKIMEEHGLRPARPAGLRLAVSGGNKSGS
jgi:energy-coupling factor transporter ATP-binding protein EcfA2